MLIFYHFDNQSTKNTVDIKPSPIFTFVVLGCKCVRERIIAEGRKLKITGFV
jgi:hypothetical protein